MRFLHVGTLKEPSLKT